MLFCDIKFLFIDLFKRVNFVSKVLPFYSSLINNKNHFVERWSLLFIQGIQGEIISIQSDKFVKFLQVVTAFTLNDINRY